MTNQATMQVRLIDYAKAPLEKLYAAFRTCYSSDTPIEIWEKIETEKIGREKIREFIGERLKTGHASPLEQVVFWFAIAGAVPANTGVYAMLLAQSDVYAKQPTWDSLRRDYW